jgi:hypothetical protein
MDSSQCAKNRRKACLNRRDAAWVRSWSWSGEVHGTGRVENSSNCLFFDGLPAAIHPGSRYNQITAADEKIPLPVVHVNNKPQYLVFR